MSTLPPRARLWPEVEAIFGRLPPAVYPAGVRLRHDLAQRFSPTGQFADWLSGPADPPWLDLAAWALADWGGPVGPTRAAVEYHATLAVAATLSAAGALASAAEPETGLAAEALPLAQALTAAAADHLAQLFPPDSAFWPRYHALTAAWQRALTTPPDWAAAPPYGDLHTHLAERGAGAALPLLSVSALTGRDADWPALAAMTADAGLAFEIGYALQAVPRDVRRGTLSYPLLRVRHAAGLAAATPVTPERLLGAALLTGALTSVAEEARARLARAQAAARALGLPTFAARLAVADEQLATLKSVWSGAASADASGVRFAPADGGLRQALDMAEQHLLADLTFAESWEVQRRGLFGQPALTGRVFAPGLILEVLAGHGLPVTDAVEALLDQLAADGYRYYPHRAVPPDADDLGLALRLGADSRVSARQRARLEEALRWLPLNQAPDGRLPCWFTHGVADLDTATPTSLWGDQCATVEANLLLGLHAHATPAARALVEAAGLGWLARWKTSGLGANAHYVAAYALWAARRLAVALAADPFPESWRAAAGAVLAAVAARLRAEAAHADTPQTAALLTLTCLGAPHQPALAALFDPQWISLILKRQRYDGAWPGEPLYVVPTRGETAGWYASTLVTTALCYDALRTFQLSRRA